MIDFSRLKDMSVPELRNLAATQGLTVHWKAKPETIINAIIEKATTVTRPQNPVAPAAPVVHCNTPADVEIAIAKIKERQPRFESTYNEEENTWKFGCLGAEESGNLAIPLKVIVKLASIISRGRVAPLAMPQTEFEYGRDKGPSAYSNVVLCP